tara:strand:+ start:1524 stop:1730 length:207 start_codon:yes stop_codon:yes gene_type:complete
LIFSGEDSQSFRNPYQRTSTKNQPLLAKGWSNFRKLPYYDKISKLFAGLVKKKKKKSLEDLVIIMASL